MKKRILLIVMPTLSLIWLALGVAIWGSFYPGYSHVSQFMSELGAAGSPIGPWVNYSVFALTEVFVLIFLWTAHNVLPRTKLVLLGLVLLCAYASFLIVGSLYPCDFECSIKTSSQTQIIHFTVGFLAYLCGLLGLFFLSRSSLQWSPRKQMSKTAYLLLVTGGLLFLGTYVLDGYNGLVQRTLEALIYGWMIGLGIQMYFRASAAP